jgi:hypothetical protein
MVSVFAIGPNVREFKAGQGDGCLRAIKISRTPFFGGDVRPEAPCRKILWHVENHFEYEQRYFEEHIHNFHRDVPPDLLLDYSAGRIARELCWTNQEFSTVDIIPPWFSMLIYHVGLSNRPVGYRSSVT